MNENEMLNPTAVETNEAAVAAAPGENVNAAPVSEPQEPKEATEAAPADEGVDEEVNEVPRATRRFNDDDLAIGAFIDDGNDMLHVDMPEDRRARDLAEMRRCVADNKHGPRRFLQGKVFGVRPVQNGSAVVEVSRGTLRVMIPAEDFFYFSLMKGIEENDATTRQRRYLRKAKLMNGAITRDNNSIYDKDGNYKVMPLLEDLQEEMRKKPELHTVCNILNPLINGSMACFNHHTNVDLDSKYIVFDFNGMKGSLLTMSMFVVLDFVWTKIKEDRTQRKAVFIDECWKLIGTDSNEQAAEDVVEIFRTIRAYGGSAFAMTQDISQFYEYKGGKYGKAIIGNADTKIIMHLIPSEAKALQEAIQLTSVEMEAVSSLPRGQGLVCSASAKLFVDFVADDYEAKEITTDAKSFYERRKALEKKKREEEEKAAENTVIDVEM